MRAPSSVLERSSGAVIDLGRVKAGQTVTLTLGAAADNALFAVLDEEALARACTALTRRRPRRDPMAGRMCAP